MGTILSVPARTCSRTEPPKSPAITSSILKPTRIKFFQLTTKTNLRPSCYSYKIRQRTKAYQKLIFWNRRNLQKETSRQKVAQGGQVMTFWIKGVEDELICDRGWTGWTTFGARSGFWSWWWWCRSLRKKDKRNNSGQSKNEQTISISIWLATDQYMIKEDSRAISIWWSWRWRRTAGRWPDPRSALAVARRSTTSSS